MPTFWPGVNPGPPAYDLGGGTWLSRRAHLLIDVKPPGTELPLTQWQQLVDIDLFNLLSVRLPAVMTFQLGCGDLRAAFPA